MTPIPRQTGTTARSRVAVLPGLSGSVLFEDIVMRDRYHPADYSVGDPIFLQVPDGWNEHSALRYVVTKKTPSGQIVAEANGRTIRITARGALSGEGGYARCTICSEATAIQLRARKRVRDAWYAIVSVSAKLERAARARDAELLDLELVSLAAAVQALRDSDRSPEGGDAQAAPFTTARADEGGIAQTSSNGGAA